jgi:hypothetical protein
MRAAGINVDAGTLYLAVVEPDGAGGPPRPVPVDCPRLAPDGDLSEADALRDLAQRVGQELAAVGVEAVGLVQTRKWKNQQYSHVYDRTMAISAVMFATTELKIDYETLTTETIGAAVGCPPKSLNLFQHATLGFDTRPKYWTTGLAEAYAAATTLVARAA